MNDYLLFDLDGTLTDPGEGITKCVQYALAAYGINEPDLKSLEPFIGPPLKDSFMEFYDFDEEKASQAVEKYRERFRDTGIFENRIYDGIPDMIRKLKGNHKKLAVASSKPTVFVERILEHFGIRKYFDVVVGSELDGTRTEKSEVVAEALRRLYGEDARDIEEKKKNTVMIGDRKFDVAGAKAEGIASIAVTYGYGPMDELKIARPDYIVRSVEELEKLLLRGTEKTAAEPPMGKLWYLLFPVLIFWFVRSIGSYIGLFFLDYLSRTLPRRMAENLVIWDETGEALAGLTGNGAAVLAAIAFCLAGLVIWFFFAKEDIKKEQKELALKHARLKGPASYCLFVLGVLGLTFGLTFLYDLIGFTNISGNYQNAEALQYAAFFWVGLILNGSLIPQAEEMLFRSVLYKRLKKYVRYPQAILISALFYGFYNQNIIQGSYAFIMGCLFAYAYERFGSFRAPLFAHEISNIAAYVLAALSLRVQITTSWLTCAVLFAVGGGALWLCFRPRIPQDGSAS